MQQRAVMKTGRSNMQLGYMCFEEKLPIELSRQKLLRVLKNWSYLCSEKLITDYTYFMKN